MFPSIFPDPRPNPSPSPAPQSIGPPAAPTVAEPIDPQSEREASPSLAAQLQAEATRKQSLGFIVGEISQLRRSAKAAGLLLKREAKLSKPGAAQLGTILGEMEETLAGIDAQRSVIMPQAPHDLDALYSAAYDADIYIRSIEALIDTMRRQLEQQPDGHLVVLCELCCEQLPKLRLALYGGDMGP
jgi:hypothetical protein